MYVLALVTQKGGSGKSTLAVGLAVAAMANGERVALVETDPQGTVSRWKERRGDGYPCVDRVDDPAHIEPVLARHRALARGLANLEAIIGQLYPATLLARLVTLELEHRRDGS